MIRFCYFSLIAVCLLIQNTQSQVLSVEEIVTNYINALGDLNKLKSVQTMRLSGEYYSNGAELPLTILKKRPNLYRLEISIGEKKIIQGYNGKTAWTINELQSPEANEIQDGRTISYLELCSDFDGALVDHQDKGHKVDYMGMDKVDGIDVYNLKITLKSSKIENWYIEESTYNLLKRTTKLPHPYEPNQPDITQYLLYMDYKPVNGISIPHYIEREDMQFIKEYVILEIEFNPDLDTNLFELYN